MSDLMTWLFGEKREPLPPQPWPTAEEVAAAREYKKKYGNFNEQMIEGAVAPNPNDERQQYRTGIPNTATVQTMPAREVLAYTNRGYGKPTPGLLSPEAADRLYAAQIAAQRNPVAALGFDTGRMVHTPDGDGRFDAKGEYDPETDELRLWSNSPTNPVHESLHRGMRVMRDENPQVLKKIGEEIAPFKEEYVVRRSMKNSYGDNELNTYAKRDRNRPPEMDSNLPAELRDAYTSNRRMDEYIKRMNAAANLLLAQRILARQGGVPW